MNKPAFVVQQHDSSINRSQRLERSYAKRSDISFFYDQNPIQRPQTGSVQPGQTISRNGPEPNGTWLRTVRPGKD